MRILIVSQYFWPESFRINDVAKRLLEKGIEIEVLTGKPNYPRGEIFLGYRAWGCQQEIYEGIEINRVPLLARGDGGWRLALNYLSFIVSGMLLAPWMLRKKRIGVIFVYAPSPILQAIPALFLGWLKGCPVVLWVQDLWPESLVATGFVRSRLALKVVEIVVRYIYRRADSILIQSEAFLVPISRMVQNAEKIHYYPNSAEEIFCTPGNDAACQGMASAIRESFSVVFAGNLGTVQALEIIVDVAERLKRFSDIRFYLVGSGSREAWLALEIQRRKLDNLILTGRLPLRDMPVILSAASALLVTLKDEPIFAYTIPSKVQVYLAVGRPIIAGLNGEGARLVEESSAGVACPAGDATALAEAVLKLYRLPPEERDQMGENGIRYFQEHFDPEKLVCELIKHFLAVRGNYKGNRG